MSEEKRISFDAYLRVLALFTMASQHYSESRKYEISLAKMLGIEDGCSFVSDVIYQGGIATRSDLDEALSRENIIVQPPEVEAAE